MAEEQQKDEREIVGLTNERGEVRNYETVASRLARFRAAYPGYTLRAEIIKDDGDSIQVKATIGFYTERDFFVVLAEGHSQEFWSSSSINRTSCVEVAETSAWGRALAAFGFGSPTGVASADEVEKAQRRERDLKEREPGVLVVLQNAAKQGMKALVAAWTELSEPDRAACGNYMAKLKAQAKKVDRENANARE